MTRDEILAAIRPFFDVNELVCPHTYAKWGEKSWQFLDTDYLHCLLVIRRDILRSAMWCNGKGKTERGLRCNRCGIVRGKSSVYLSAHCFDQETELLTGRGWQKHDTIREDDVMFSYNMNTGLIEKKPVAYLTKEHYRGKMVQFKSVNVDCLVTDGHDMILHYIPDKYVRVGNKNYTEKGVAYFDSLKTDNDKWHKEPAINQVGKRRVYMCAAESVKEKDCDLNFMKFCLATIADGFFEFRYDKPAIGFRFKKDRKCKQIEELMSELGWHFTKRLDKYGVWNYYIRSEYAIPVYDTIGRNKNIPFEVLDYGSDALRAMVEYYALYDGCHSKRDNDKHFTICTTNAHNADMLQLMSALSGMRCQYSVKRNRQYKIGESSGTGKDAYMLTINPGTSSSRMNNKGTSVVDYEGVVWCASNENGTVISRRNGKITIQGNCLGKAGDFDVTGMTAEQARMKIKEKASLLPCNIRVEEGVSWLHFDVLSQYGVKQKVYGFRA